MLERKLELLSKAVGAPTFAVSSEKVAVKLIVSNPGWLRAQPTVGFLANGPVQWDSWRLAQGLESFHFFVSLILVTESPFSCTTQTRAGVGGQRAEAEIAANSELWYPRRKKNISNPSSVVQHLHLLRYAHIAGNGQFGISLKEKLLYRYKILPIQCSSVVQSCPTLCNPMNCSTPGFPCLSPTPGVYSDSCLLSRWCHPTTSSSVIPFSSCLQSFPASGSFQMSQFYTSGGQSIGVSASASVLPMNIQDWFPWGWTGWISLQSKGLSRVFSSTTVQKHQFFSAILYIVQLSHPYMTMNSTAN